MERFVYIGKAGSNDSTYIGSKTRYLKPKSLGKICSKITFYPENIIYFTNQDACSGVIDKNMIGNLDSWNVWIDKLTSFINGTLRTGAGWNNDDLIYVSIHPGGGDSDSIKAKLLEINEKLKKDKVNIKITYHGSQCITDWNEIKTIDKLNKRVKKFIEPDVEAEMKNNNEIVLLQKALLDELFIDGNEVNEELLKSVFNIENFDDKKVKIIKVIKDYRDLLDKTNNSYQEFIELIRNKPENNA